MHDGMAPPPPKKKEYMKLKVYTAISRKRTDPRAVTSNIHGASSSGTSTVMIQSTVPDYLVT